MERICNNVTAERWQIVEQTGQAVPQLADPSAPHLCIDKQEGTAGERDRPLNLGHQLGEIKPQTSDLKLLWGLRWQQEKLPVSQERSLERGLERAQAHPLGNQH